MQKTISLNIFIIVTIIVFIVCGGLGVFFEMQRTLPQVKGYEKASILVKGLSSRIVPAITAVGQVKEIEGNMITLISGTDTMKIKVRDDAQIYSFLSSVQGAKPVTVNQTAKLKDITKNDTLNISAKLLPDGSLEGISVIIFDKAPVIPAE